MPKSYKISNTPKMVKRLTVDKPTTKMKGSGLSKGKRSGSGGFPRGRGQAGSMASMNKIS
jgi:hypothetical protein